MQNENKVLDWDELLQTFGPPIEDDTENIWEVWLNKGLWDYREAARLVGCGRLGCVLLCVKDVSNGYHTRTSECFSRTLADGFDMVTLVLELYESENWPKEYLNDNRYFPEKVSPYLFIKWAKTKPLLKLPKQMHDWYNQQTKLSRQRGSNKEDLKRKETIKFCKIVENKFAQGLYDNKLDTNGRLGIEEFFDCVREEMSKVNNSNFQPHAARTYYYKVCNLPNKRRKGHNKT